MVLQPFFFARSVSISFMMLNRQEEIVTMERNVEGVLSDCSTTHSQVCHCLFADEDFSVIPYNYFYWAISSDVCVLTVGRSQQL